MSISLGDENNQPTVPKVSTIFIGFERSQAYHGNNGPDGVVPVSSVLLGRGAIVGFQEVESI